MGAKATILRLIKVVVSCYVLCAGIEAQARKATEVLDYETARDRAATVTDLLYHIDIVITNEGKNFVGKSTITFNLNSNQTDLTVDLRDASIRNLILNDQKLNVQTSYNRFFIVLPAKNLKTGSNTLAVEYQNTIPSIGSGLNRYQGDENTLIYSDFEPYRANTVFPCFDQPDMKGKFRIAVTAPEAWQVISTGQLLKRTKTSVRGELHWEFQQTPALSPHLLALYAGNFKQRHNHGSPKISLSAVPDALGEKDANGLLAAGKLALQGAEKTLSTPFVGKKIDIIALPFDWPSPHAPLGVMLVHPRHLTKLHSSERVVPYEITRQLIRAWLQPMVGMKWWDDRWLYEGLAILLSHQSAFTKQTTRHITFHRDYKLQAFENDELATAAAVYAPFQSIDAAKTESAAVMQGKSAALLKNLQFLIGDQKFFLALKAWIRNNKLASVPSTSFISSINQVASKDQLALFDALLTGTGINTLEATSICKDSEPLRVTTLLKRDTASATHRHRFLMSYFDVTPQGGFKEHPASLVLQAEDRQSLELTPQKRCPNLVFANKENHAYFRLNFGEKEYNLLMGLLPSIKNPLDRMLLLAELWRAVMNGDVAFSAFNKLTLQLAKDEQHLSIVEAILSWVNGTSPAYRFSTLAHQANTVKRTAVTLPWTRLALEKIRYSKNQEERQLWLHFLAKLSYGKEAAPEVVKLLSLKNKSMLTAAMRQEVTLSLVANDYSGADALVKSESESLKGTAKSNYLLAAASSKNDLTTKRKFFEEISRIDSSLNDYQKAIVIQHLFPESQEELHMKFTDDFYNIVPTLTHAYPSQFIDLYTKELIPVFCSTNSDSRLKKFLEHNEKISPVALKNLKDAREQEDRCFKTQTPPRKVD